MADHSFELQHYRLAKGDGDQGAPFGRYGRVQGAAEADLSGAIEASPTPKSEGHMRRESGLANRRFLLLAMADQKSGARGPE